MKNAAFFVISLARVSELDFSFIFNAFCLFEDIFFRNFQIHPHTAGGNIQRREKPCLSQVVLSLSFLPIASF